METQKPSFKKMLKPFPCVIPFCTQTFKDQGELLEHLRMHRLVKQDQGYNVFLKYEINFNISASDLSCNLLFNSQQSLNNNRSGTLGRKPHRCEICNQSFTQVKIRILFSNLTL